MDVEKEDKEDILQREIKPATMDLNFTHVVRLLVDFDVTEGEERKKSGK